MNIEKHHKRDIAARQLETALLLYFAGKDLFSVITLAGAAEEILGDLLRLAAGPTEEGTLRSVLKLFRPVKAQQRAEALASFETDLYVHMDLRNEAEFLLGRAIDDYHALTGELSDYMEKYNQEVRSRRG